MSPLTRCALLNPSTSLGEVHYPSNADRIRSMADEELADYLRYYSDSYARHDMDWLDWLKEEAEEGE